MFSECHGHSLEIVEMMRLFYEGLTEESKHELDICGGGNFLYHPPAVAYKIMEDRELMNVNRARAKQDIRIVENVARIEVKRGGIDPRVFEEVMKVKEEMSKEIENLK